MKISIPSIQMRLKNYSKQKEKHHQLVLGFLIFDLRKVS